jgi:hypothetical protein
VLPYSLIKCGLLGAPIEQTRNTDRIIDHANVNSKCPLQSRNLSSVPCREVYLNLTGMRQGDQYHVRMCALSIHTNTDPE